MFPSVIINVTKTRSIKKESLLKSSKRFLSEYVINSFELNVWLRKTKEYYDLVEDSQIFVIYGKTI